MRSSAALDTRPARAAAAGASLLVVLTILAYLAAPVAGAPTVSQRFARAASETAVRVSGVVRLGRQPMAGARVVLRVRDRRGRLLRIVTLRTDARGRFVVVLPRGAVRVRVIVVEARRNRPRTASRLVEVRPGEAIELTAVFPGPRARPVLPGLFPY